MSLKEGYKRAPPLVYSCVKFVVGHQAYFDLFGTIVDHGVTFSFRK